MDAAIPLDGNSFNLGAIDVHTEPLFGRSQTSPAGRVVSEVPKVLEISGLSSDLCQPLLDSLQRELEAHEQTALLDLTSKLISARGIAAVVSETGLSRIPLRQQAEIVGTTFFHSILAQKDPLLAEELADSYEVLSKGKGVVDAAITRLALRLRDFYLASKEHFLPMAQIFQDASKDGGQSASIYLTKGVFAPYFVLAPFIEQTEKKGFFDRFKTAATKYEHLVPAGAKANPADLRFLATLIDGLSGQTVRDVTAIANPTLKKIMQSSQDPKQILSMSENWLENTEEISVADLIMLLEKLPRAINWGREESAVLQDAGINRYDGSGNYIVSGECLDLIILSKALNKLKSNVGIGQVEKLSPLVQQVVTLSRTYKYLQAESCTKLLGYFTNLLSLAVSDIASAPKKSTPVNQ